MLPTIPKLCGVKRSVFCTLVSVWGAVMLAIMGLLLSYKSLSFVEDIEVEEDNNLETFILKQDRKYDSAARNCYIATLMYSVTFLVSIYHWTAYQQRGLV